MRRSVKVNTAICMEKAFIIPLRRDIRSHYDALDLIECFPRAVLAKTGINGAH